MSAVAYGSLVRFKVVIHISDISAALNLKFESIKRIRDRVLAMVRLWT